jgi:calcineurin-like phosphoesterase family protein
MSVYFISDLHLGHKRITQFEGGKWRNWADSPEEHDHELISRINQTVQKRDKLFILGDVVFGRKNIEMLGEIQGYKHSILGNHDTEDFNYKDYMPYVDKISGLEGYKSHWLSHAPIHPLELRGRKNIHGHTHHNSIRDQYSGEYDKNYINVCVEALDGYPIAFEDIQSGKYWELKKI